MNIIFLFTVVGRSTALGVPRRIIYLLSLMSLSLYLVIHLYANQYSSVLLFSEFFVQSVHRSLLIFRISHYLSAAHFLLVDLSLSFFLFILITRPRCAERI